MILHFWENSPHPTILSAHTVQETKLLEDKQILGCSAG